MIVALLVVVVVLAVAIVAAAVYRHNQAKVEEGLANIKAAADLLKK